MKNLHFIVIALLSVMLAGCVAEKTQVIHITKDNLYSLEQLLNEDNDFVVWIDDNLVEHEGVQNPLIELVTNEVRLIFLRGTINTNTVADYLGIEYPKQVYPDGPGYVAVKVYLEDGKYYIVDIHADPGLEHEALENASKSDYARFNVGN